MTKQELEKAIENGESVWVVFNQYSYENDSVKEIDWMKVEGVELRDNYLQYFNGKNLCGHYYKLTFKTKAEAEHYLHHANVERVEKLPFLTWEEFDKGNRFIRFIGKNGEKCKLEGYQKDDKQSGFIDVVVNGTGSHIDFDYTEANFYKAYDECVRLFRSGEQL